MKDLLNWFKDQITRFASWLWDVITHAFVYACDVVMELFSSIVELIGVPSFLQNVSLCNYLEQVHPYALWLMGTFRISEGLALIAAGYAFRLLRKLLTLGQW